MTLYELTVKQLELKANLLAMDFDTQTIADTIEGESGEIQEKMEGYGFVITDRLSFAEAIKAEIDRMTARLNAELKRIKNIEDRLLAGMIACEISKVETPHFTISVQNNPPSVEIFNDKLIPEELMRLPEPKPPVAAPDKKAILAKLKAGEDVAGCVIVQKQRLVIK